MAALLHMCSYLINGKPAFLFARPYSFVHLAHVAQRRFHFLRLFLVLDMNDSICSMAIFCEIYKRSRCNTF